MNLLTDREFCAALVLSLGHFLWQGLVVAVLSAVATRSLKSASVRYAGLLLAFGVMAISPIVTLVMLAAPARSPSIAPVSPAIRPMAADTLVEVPVATRPTIDGQTDFDPTPQKSGPVPESPPAAQRAPGGFEGEAEPAVPSADSSWRWFAPLMTDVYLLGVMAMLLRLTVGLWGGWRLRRNSMPVSDGALLEALAQQAASLGMRFIPMLAYCERVAVPTVIGILKPTILLPLALTSRLSPDQIEAVLTHELAHLRRYDHLVNLAQRFVESLLFFHPAVWWLSHKIRVEREHCCDDLVVACGAMPLDYAKSLLRVAELSRGAMSRRSVSAVSLLATGQPSTLRQRIARLLGDSAAPQVRLAHSLFVFGLGGTCCLLAWGMTTLVVNKLRGTLACCAVKAPGFGDRRKEMLKDIATLTGGQVIAEELGLKLENVTISDLGRAKTIKVDKDNTTIVDGAGAKEKIKARQSEIRGQIENTTSDYDREKLQERLAKLVGGVAVIKVGAATETEMKEKKARVEDALHATRRPRRRRRSDPRAAGARGPEGERRAEVRRSDHPPLDRGAPPPDRGERRRRRFHHRAEGEGR